MKNFKSYSPIEMLLPKYKVSMHILFGGMFMQIVA